MTDGINLFKGRWLLLMEVYSEIPGRISPVLVKEKVISKTIIFQSVKIEEMHVVVIGAGAAGLAAGQVIILTNI